MSTKIITAIYFDLYGTPLGGRVGRSDHYLYSLNSIMNINNANFIIYTNDAYRVDNFYKQYYPDKTSKFISIEYDLYNTQYKEKINKIKNTEETKKSDRCIELQYSKFLWLLENLHNCDHIYWIDAGLCYSGLIPDKYLKVYSPKVMDHYYGSDIFTNNFINNLNSLTQNKMFVCAKENIINYWDSSVPSQYFKDKHKSDHHIIGGLFGGKTEIVDYIGKEFSTLADTILDNENFLYSEEQIFSCVFFNNLNHFIYKHFDIWWHEDNIHTLMDKESGKRCLANNKSFYKIIEELL